MTILGPDSVMSNLDVGMTTKSPLPGWLFIGFTLEESVTFKCFSSCVNSTDPFCWVGALSPGNGEDNSWQCVRRLCLLVGPVIGTMVMTLVTESSYIAWGVRF